MGFPWSQKARLAIVLDFPPFTLDDERHQLLKDGLEVHLSLKAYELLKLVLESSPGVVKRTELYDRLWSDPPSSPQAAK